MATEKIDWERGGRGEILPSIKNREIMATLQKKYKTYNELIAAIGEKDCMDYSRAVLFDPRQETMVYRTKEQAISVAKYGIKIDKKDENFLLGPDLVKKLSEKKYRR